MARRSFTLRDVRKEDFPQLWRIDRACFAPGIAYSRRELAAYIAHRNAFTLVAELSGAHALKDASNIIGFLIAEHDRRGVGHIITIDVLPESRRSGLGRELMRQAEERLRAAGCTAITLEAAVDNVAALTFYQRLHYAILRTIPRYYNNAVDGLLLRKELTADA